MCSLPSIFLINLDRDTERLERMKGELDRCGLPFERVQAIYGTQLPEHLKQSFLDEQGHIASDLKKGEVGCYASHLIAQQEMLRRGLDYALILEDDLKINDDFLALITKLLNLAKEWDIIRLSNDAKRSVIKIQEIAEGRHLVKYSRVPNNTGAYLISAYGARKFAQRVELRRYPLDVDLRRGWYFGLRTFGVLPAPVQPNIGESRIDSIETRDTSQPFWRKAYSRTMTGRTEFGVAATRRIAYNIGFLGWKNWIKCTIKDLYWSVEKKIKSQN
jgi:glycosyl transferase family 25